MTRLACTSAFALATLVAGAGSVGAQTTLIFATTNPANAHLTVQVMRPWAERINEQGKGVVKIDIRDGLALANLTNAYERVVNDVVQIAWTLPGYVAGKFPRTQVTSLPFVSGNGEEGSVAMARLYQDGLLAAEYDEVVPLMLVQIAHSGLQTAKPLKSLDDLAGSKLIVTSRTHADTIAKLGATPQSIPLTDMYEAIQRGTVDGAAVGWTAFQPFKLAEVTNYHVETQLGASMGMVFMARKKYAALPEEVRRVIDANSGEAASREFGRFWDRVGAATRDQVKAMSGHTVVIPSAAQIEAWRQKTSAVIDAWSKATPDGEKVLGAFRTTLAKVKGGS